MFDPELGEGWPDEPRAPEGRRVALLGGSFNPPHVAHQMVALWTLSTEMADEVWFMPCHHHPFGKDLESFEHRVRMCMLACQALPRDRVHVTRIEAEDPDEHRTLFTLRLLVERHPGCHFVLIIGADILQEKNNWYRFDEIERLVKVVVVGRSGYAGPEDAVVLPAISSTDIRRRLAEDRATAHLLPRPVLAYIRKHGLYGIPRSLERP